MRFRRHVLRDLFLLSLPATAVLGYLAAATAVTFYNGEILNFPGYLVGRTRVGALKAALKRSALPLLRPEEEKVYLSDRREPAKPPGRVFDLRVKGSALEALESELVASAKNWQRAKLFEGAEIVPVEVCYRGQMLSSFFWAQKSWKIKTTKSRLVDGYRVINLAPLQDRMAAYLGKIAAREAGLPAPEVRLARLYLNKKDQGLYVQEEQIDESMIRRIGRMPGDVFYGERFTPEDPKSSSNELFWNPYLWSKHDRNNKYSEEFRPYLVDFLDQVCDDSPASLDRLYRLLDLDQFALWLAVLSDLGDQHLDHHHNHKLYFNPLSGKFEPILWDPLFQMSKGDGVEPAANRLTMKLARDPRFLDRAQKLLHDRLYRKDVLGALLRELDRIEEEYGRVPLNYRSGLLEELRRIRKLVADRRETLRRLEGAADARFTTRATAEGTELTLYARSLASLRLRAMELAGEADGVEAFEDRDADGRIGPADREIAVAAEGRRLWVREPEALVYVGRDFSAPYRAAPGEDPAAARAAIWSARTYTRLAYLPSRYLLRPRSRGRLPAVTGLILERTVGDGSVSVRAGAPDGPVATETFHPWSLPAPGPPRHYRFSGEVRLLQDLIVREKDSFEAAPGTRFRLGPGASLVLRSRVVLDGITMERLDPSRPWGVLALQGPAASGSVVENCRISGGSEDTLEYVYYSGMLSVHDADRVTLRRSVVASNVHGDDTVRFANANGLRVEGVRVEESMGDAIDCDLSSGLIADTTIIGPRNDGIDLMTSQVDVRRVVIRGSGDKGISVGEGATPEITDCEIRDSVTGIAIKDTSEPVIRGVLIEGCNVGVGAYHKNWRYGGGGRGRMTDSTLRGNRVDARLDSSSTLVLEGCATEGRFDLPPDLATGAFQNLSPRGGGGGT